MRSLKLTQLYQYEGAYVSMGLLLTIIKVAEFMFLN